ncbi:cysteine dioxygenase [Chromobacterium subtsugae]|uniref:cysteine dioxygenase n=1 Tax=Chromobacterium subtsugae TaxID=251747 RepID=UPI000A3E91F5|nr:cysteine dioxygenase family protein [Chromobacterium subtsugae]
METPNARAPIPAEISPGLLAALKRLEQFQARLSLEDIRGFHRSLRLGRADFAPFWLFGDSQYRRNRIYADDFCELLLLCWRSGQRSQIHNHRGSLCGVRVLQGVATETVFEETPAGLLASRETRELAAGSLVINGDQDIHQIANQQDGDLVTLHLYSPPLRQMRLLGLEPQHGRARLPDDCLEYQI